MQTFSNPRMTKFIKKSQGTKSRFFKIYYYVTEVLLFFGQNCAKNNDLVPLLIHKIAYIAKMKISDEY